MVRPERQSTGNTIGVVVSAARHRQRLARRLVDRDALLGAAGGKDGAPVTWEALAGVSPLPLAGWSSVVPAVREKTWRAGWASTCRLARA
jgi:hypothetical protein